MEYLVHLGILFAIYAILALSLNLVVGYTGLVSVTHAAFFGIGAYGSAILQTLANWNFFPALTAGIVAGMTIAILIGKVLSKFKGDFFVLGSIGFNIIVYSVMLNWQSLTNGPLGIAGIPRPSFFGLKLTDNFHFLLLTACCLLLVYLACQFIVDSALGRALKAIREDEQALSVYGYKTINYKLMVFILSAGLAAVGGGLFAAYISYIDPTSFGLSESVFILSMIILGGLANLRGSLIGAIFLTLLPEILRFVGFPSETAAQLRHLSYGLLLLVLMMYRPQGLIGEYKL